MLNYTCFTSLILLDMQEDTIVRMMNEHSSITSHLRRLHYQ
jgi:hypothetical protein